MTAGSLISAVEPFHYLFERAAFCRNSIIVGKSDHLSDFKCEIFPELLCEFHCGEGIGAVAISDELKVFRQLFQSPECHAHGEDAGADAASIGYLVTDTRGIHDKPDVCFEAADFYVGFVGSKGCSFFVGILVDKGLDAVRPDWNALCVEEKSIDLPFLVSCPRPKFQNTKGDNAHGHYTILTFYNSISLPAELLVD